MGTPEQVPGYRRGRRFLGLRRRPGRTTSTRSGKRGRPTDLSGRTIRGKPRNLLELIAWVIDDSARTLRAGVLIAITATCIAGIVFVIQLRPERWAYVTGAAGSILLIAQAIRRRKYDKMLEELIVMTGFEDPHPDRKN